MNTFELLQNVERASRLLYANREAEGMELVKGLLEPVQQTAAALLHAFGQMQADTTQEQQCILQSVRQLVEAYRNCDLLQMADVLKYEILEYIRLYQRMVA